MDSKPRKMRDEINAHIGIWAMITVVILSALILFFLIKSPMPLLISAKTAPQSSTPVKGQLAGKLI